MRGSQRPFVYGDDQAVSALIGPGSSLLKGPTVSGSNCSPATFSMTERGSLFVKRFVSIDHRTPGIFGFGWLLYGAQIVRLSFLPKAGEVEHTEFPVSIDDL